MSVSGDEYRRAADDLFRSTLSDVAAMIAPTTEKRTFLEARTEDAYMRILASRGVGVERTGSRDLKGLPEWKGAMKKWDLEVTLPGDERATVFLEAKVDEVDETLWDLYKLASAQLWPRVRDGYLAVACVAGYRGSDRPCAALFAEKPEVQVWQTRELICRYEAAWDRLLGPNGSAKPFELPETIATRFIGRASVAGFPGNELRVIAVSRPRDAAIVQLDEHGKPRP